MPDADAETILLVDDEPGVRRLALHVLRTHGYAVLEAADGAEGLRLAEAHAGPIHLLVTDVIMPGMGGGPLAETLVARRPGLKVLFTSGYPDDVAGRPGIPPAQGAFLQKPFTPAGLAQKVREVLGQ